MTNLIKTRALIINAIKWKDSSRIVTLFTENRGKIKVIAHGAAREKSPFRGKLETLNLVESILSFRESRSLQVLTELTVLSDFRILKSDFSKMACAFAVIEVIDHVFHEEETDSVFFDFLAVLLGNLEKTGQPKWIWWFFLLKIASYLGFKPDLDACAFCGQKPVQKVYFAIGKGVVYCSECLSGDEPVRVLDTEEYGTLLRIQHSHHKKIGLGITGEETGQCDLTGLLIDYLNTHLGYDLHLKSLDLMG